MIRSAIFDVTRKYRYTLKRVWDESKGKVVYIMLNPSFADDDEDDPTTKRCINFTKKFGYGSLEIVNLFAYITSNPDNLKHLNKQEAIGKENENHIIPALNNADKIIAAWGENSTIHGRHMEIEELIAGYDIDSLGPPCKNGQPRHPLYLSSAIELVPYKRPENKVKKLIATVPSKRGKGREGALIKDGTTIKRDDWLWCEVCHEDFCVKIRQCKSCLDLTLKRFKDFLIREYSLSEKSAKDYIGRFNGITNRQLYNGESQLTPALKTTIEKEFPKSTNHYFLTLKRYMAFQKDN